jgi:hypothetical protein
LRIWNPHTGATAIQKEIAREVDQLQRVIFSARRKTGCLDLEAVEMAVRSAMHHAGATALTELLQFPAPAADQRTLACPCGRHGWDETPDRKKQQIQRGVQLDLPVAMGEPIPILYVQMDGTGVPVVNKETVGRKGKTGW